MVRDAVRLAVGTLTVVRVRPPAAVTPQVAGAAMGLAPLLGVGLGSAAAGALWTSRHFEVAPLVGAALAVALLAALTRAIHLDGLADTADGLGSGQEAQRALEIMRRSDIGPFGVVTLLLVLLLDVSAAASLPARALLLAVVIGRLAVPLAARRGVVAARHEGLGEPVAETVPAFVAVTLAAAGVALGAALLGVAGGAAALAGLVAAELLLRRCRRRLGGVTGDVFGALVETATVVTLVTLTVAH